MGSRRDISQKWKFREGIYCLVWKLVQSFSQVTWEPSETFLIGLRHVVLPMGQYMHVIELTHCYTKLKYQCPASFAQAAWYNGLHFILLWIFTSCHCVLPREWFPGCTYVFGSRNTTDNKQLMMRRTPVFCLGKSSEFGSTCGINVANTCSDRGNCCLLHGSAFTWCPHRKCCLDRTVESWFLYIWRL